MSKTKPSGRGRRRERESDSDFLALFLTIFFISFHSISDPLDVTEPVFVLEPTGQVLMEGDSALLECVANGYPSPEIRWLKEDKVVSVDDDRIKHVGHKSLLIHKLSAADAGTYTCRATNSEESKDASAALEVKGSFSTLTSFDDLHFSREIRSIKLAHKYIEYFNLLTVNSIQL